MPNPDSESENTLFGATPIWERSRKKRGFGGRKSAAPKPEAPKAEPPPPAAETRSFAQDEPDMILNRPLAAEQPLQTGPTVTHSTLAAEEPEPMATPIRAARVASRRSGPSAAMIAGGVAVLALIAVGGWWLARPHDGVPELTPATPSEIAAAPAPPPLDVPPTATAQAEQPAAAAPSRAGPATNAPRQVAQAARVRPAARAAAPSASESGANASAVLPDGPRPYSSLNPSAPTQVTPPPSEAAPAIPQTPPVEPPASQTTPPTPPSA